MAKESKSRALYSKAAIEVGKYARRQYVKGLGQEGADARRSARRKFAK